MAHPFAIGVGLGEDDVEIDIDVRNDNLVGSSLIASAFVPLSALIAHKEPSSNWFSRLSLSLVFYFALVFCSSACLYSSAL